MPDSQEKVTFDLDLEDGDYGTKLDSAIKKLDELGEHGKSSGDGITEGFLKAEIIIEGFKLALEAIKQGFEFLGEAIHDAMQHEQEVVALNLAITNSGYASAEASHSMMEYAEQLAKASTFSDGMILKLEAQAINLTTTEAAAKKMTKAAVELSAATGKDLNSSMQVLALSLQGVASRGLDKLIPGMRGLTQSQLQAGMAADMIIEKFGGSALTVTQTFSGRVQILKNSFEEFREQVGKVITDSPIVNRALEGMSELVGKATEMITEWANGGGFNKLLESLVQISDGIITYIVRPLEFVYNVGTMVFDTLKLGAASIVFAFATAGAMLTEVFVAPLISMMKTAAAAVGVFSDSMAEKINGAMEKVKEKTKDVVNNVVGATKDTMDKAAAVVAEDTNKMFDFKISEKLDGSLQSIKQFFEGAKAPVNGLKTDMKKTKAEVYGLTNAFKDMGSGFKLAMDDMNKNATKNFETIGKTMFTTLGQGAGKAFAAFGKAMATGQDGLKAFTNSIIATMGEMAIQLGTQFMLQGFAMMWADNPKGIPMMEAGAALAAFGGVMSAVGGGGGGGGASVAASGGEQGGGAFGPQTPMSSSNSPVAKSSAQIVIQGDFLNSRETGNHLAEILRQNSDITDYTITAQGKSYSA